MHMSAGACRDQKRAPDSLELELQVIVNHCDPRCAVDPGSQIQIPCKNSPPF